MEESRENQTTVSLMSQLSKKEYPIPRRTQLQVFSQASFGLADQGLSDNRRAIQDGMSGTMWNLFNEGQENPILKSKPIQQTNRFEVSPKLRRWKKCTELQFEKFPVHLSKCTTCLIPKFKVNGWTTLLYVKAMAGEAAGRQLQQRFETGTKGSTSYLCSVIPLDRKFLLLNAMAQGGFTFIRAQMKLQLQLQPPWTYYRK